MDPVSQLRAFFVLLSEYPVTAILLSVVGSIAWILFIEGTGALIERLQGKK